MLSDCVIILTFAINTTSKSQKKRAFQPLRGNLKKKSRRIMQSPFFYEMGRCFNRKIQNDTSRGNVTAVGRILHYSPSFHTKKNLFNQVVYPDGKVKGSSLRLTLIHF